MTDVPIAAYHVSGEYAMVHAAARTGGSTDPPSCASTCSSIKRAGADLILTYAARAIAEEQQ